MRRIKYSFVIAISGFMVASLIAGTCWAQNFCGNFEAKVTNNSNGSLTMTILNSTGGFVNQGAPLQPNSIMTWSGLADE